jgi:hypothetical protein
MVVVSSPQMIEDLRKTTDEQMTFHAGVEEASSSLFSWLRFSSGHFVQLLYIQKILGPRPHRLYEIDVVRNPLTRNIGVLFDELYDEAVTAMNELVPIKDGKLFGLHSWSIDAISVEWVKFPAARVLMIISSRTSNRAYVGLPLCQSNLCVVNFNFDIS